MSGTDQRLALTTLAGITVRDAHGRRLGEIEDLAVNVAGGTIDYATLRIIPDRSRRQLQVVIPWSQFRLAANGGHLELNIDLETLRRVAMRRAGR